MGRLVNVTRPSLLANSHVLKLGFPFHGEWSIGALSFLIPTFQRYRTQVLGEDIPGFQNWQTGWRRFICISKEQRHDCNYKFSKTNALR